jgi:hypothetical protein
MSEEMTRVEAEWIVGLGVAALRGKSYLVRESLLNFGPGLMSICPKCKRRYYMDCIDCTFRNGGGLRQAEEREKDLCEEMSGLVTDAGYRLENALRWMQVRWDE